MEKKNVIKVKLPYYFGFASIMLLLVTVICLGVSAPVWVLYGVFFLGIACAVAGLIAAGMQNGESEEERKYRRLGVILCIIMFLIDLAIIWFYVTWFIPIVNIFS